MNFIQRIRLLIVWSGLIFPFFLLEGSPALRTGLNEKTAAVLSLLEKFHYRKVAFDAKVQGEIHHDFLTALDPSGLIFLKEDEALLTSIPFNPSQIRGQSSIPFFEMTLARFRLRLQETLSLLDQIGKGDVAVNEPVHFVRSTDIIYSENAKERLLRWKKLVRYRLLLQTFFSLPSPRSEAGFQELLAVNESRLRSSILAGERRRITELLGHPEGFDNVIARLFINTIVTRYDPHSVFISPAQKQGLESMLSSQAYSYGVILSRTPSGETRIDRVVPGGPAWKSARLNRDDVVLQISYPGEGDRAVEVADLSLEEVYGAVNDPKTSRLILTVRKASGLIQRVPLAKEKMAVEENNVSGFVLGGKRKVGYIYLPAFYTEWDNPGSSVCANDVAREIMKLKREKIEGLILDLRNNGGGSVREALNLAGIFIDEGPICIRSSNEGKPRVLKDPVRGLIYDGPLVVLVNGRSASASEFFAAALRDYNRAVLVGTRTYGKGSGQMILPVVSDPSQIDQAMRHPGPGMDYLKITTDLYYDLYGHTHQREGINPDIVLPDPLFENSEGEKDAPYSIEPTAISKTAYFEKGPDLPRRELVRRSERRRSRFDGVMALSKQVRKYLEPGDVPLNEAGFFKTMNERMDTFERFEAAMHVSESPLSVNPVSFDSDIIRMDPYKKELYARLVDQIRADLYINEGYDVMMDLIDAR